jgi:hypothetical protein
MKRNSHKRFICFTLALLLTGLLSAPAFGWGAQGHRIVAMVAERRLTMKARKAIEDLLGDQTLEDVANYADAVRNQKPETANFHFVDIPVLKPFTSNKFNTYDKARDCKVTDEGDCVIEALNRFIKEANDKDLKQGQRAFALKFIVHLVGDLHQPLHCADDNDRGGNQVKITWFGRKGKGINLHALWDRLIIEQAELTELDFANELEFEFTEQQASEFRKGTLIDWANESHRLAKQFAYAKLPPNRVLGQKYYDETFMVVDEQLFKAGVRLAAVLNTIYK